MDLQGYKIQSTTKCECGYEFDIHDMKKLQRIPENNFYGGVVRHVDEIKCPQCQRDTLLLIKQQGQTYIVKDIAQKDTIGEENNDNVANNKMVIEQNEDIITETSTIENKEETTSNNGIICPVCQKSFKNKSGLSLHMKTHENK